MSRHGKIADDMAQIGVVLPKWVKEELTRLAKAERRSLSSYAAWQLEIHAKAKRDSATLGTPAERPTRQASATPANGSAIDLAREIRGDGQRGNQGRLRRMTVQ